MVATWEGYDDTNASHTLNDISAHSINALFKTEMTGILDNTPNTKFTVKDAQERAQANTGKDKGWGSFLKDGENMVDRFGQSINNFGSRAQQWWNNIQSLF